MVRGIRGNISALFETFNAKKLCSKGLSRECQFYSLNSEVAFLSHSLGDVKVTYAIYPLLESLQSTYFIMKIFDSCYGWRTKGEHSSIWWTFCPTLNYTCVPVILFIAIVECSVLAFYSRYFLCLNLTNKLSVFLYSRSVTQAKVYRYRIGLYTNWRNNLGLLRRSTIDMPPNS